MGLLRVHSWKKLCLFSGAVATEVTAHLDTGRDFFLLHVQSELMQNFGIHISAVFWVPKAIYLSIRYWRTVFSRCKEFSVGTMLTVIARYKN